MATAIGFILGCLIVFGALFVLAIKDRPEWDWRKMQAKARQEERLRAYHAQLTYDLQHMTEAMRGALGGDLARFGAGYREGR